MIYVLFRSIEHIMHIELGEITHQIPLCSYLISSWWSWGTPKTTQVLNTTERISGDSAKPGHTQPMCRAHGCGGESSACCGESSACCGESMPCCGSGSTCQTQRGLLGFAQFSPLSKVIPMIWGRLKIETQMIGRVQLNLPPSCFFEQYEAWAGLFTLRTSSYAGCLMIRGDTTPENWDMRNKTVSIVFTWILTFYRGHSLFVHLDRA